MSSEPAYNPLLRILIGLACGLLGLVAMVLVGALVEAPVRAVVDGINAHFGGVGIYLSLFALVGGLWWWAASGNRAEERRRIAETGQMEHRHRPFSQDGWARNLAILLTPFAILTAIGLAMWLTGTPLPRAILR